MNTRGQNGLLTATREDNGSRPLLSDIAQVYGLLSEAFQYPDDLYFSRMESGAFVEEFEGSVSRLPRGDMVRRAVSALARDVSHTLSHFSLLDLQAACNRLFVLSAVRQQGQISLFGTVYTAAHEYMQSNQLAALSGLYRSFGLQCIPGQRPDHISPELEFLRAVTSRSTLAMSLGQEEVLRHCQTETLAFLSGHFNVWLPALCRALANRQPRLYPSLARLTRGFAAWHMAALQRELA